MNTYAVRVAVEGFELYEIQAESEDDARKNWFDGQLITSENNCAHVESVELMDRIAVVELPADDVKALEHFEFGGGGVRQYDPNGFGSYRWFSFDEIRTLAPALLAMLAAADAAEASQ